MRILLVTLTGYLPFALTQVLSQDLEYCAIVVDEPEPAKKMLDNVPPLREKVYPFYELPDVMKLFYYDVLVFVSDDRTYAGALIEHFKKNGLKNENFVHIYLTNGANNPFMLKRAMHYFKDHSQAFEMFATGISYVASALDATQFKRRLFNFGRGGQDLYYDYQVAKFIIQVCGGVY